MVNLNSGLKIYGNYLNTNIKSIPVEIANHIRKICEKNTISMTNDSSVLCEKASQHAIFNENYRGGNKKYVSKKISDKNGKTRTLYYKKNKDGKLERISKENYFIKKS